MLPLSVELEGREVLVVGAGRVAARKAAQLLEAGAVVHVIAAELVAELPPGIASVTQRLVRAEDLDGRFLVVSATGDPVANEELAAAAEERRIWLNTVDDPGRSSFYFTALHRAGEVVVSVSSSGAAPALAQELRDRLAAALPPATAEAARRLRAERAAVHEQGVSTEDVDWRPRVRELLDGPEA
jgi:siroheme synthase-like protein